MNQSQLLKRTIPWWKQYRDELARPIKKHSNLFNLLTVCYSACLQQITPNGWAEGECRGKAGWFPAAYVERRENIPPNKVFPQA
jgi:hypothetical protein